MTLPKLPGLRIIKSAVAVFICFCIDYFRSGGIPFYSAIAAILCMQPDVQNSVRVALNRTIGTLIGGGYGMLILLLIQRLPIATASFAAYAILSAALIPLMYLTVVFKRTPSTYITCVVFLCITVSHGEDVNPYLFAVNRVVDTLIGIFVSLGVNVLPFMKNKKMTGDTALNALQPCNTTSDDTTEHR